MCVPLAVAAAGAAAVTSAAGQIMGGLQAKSQGKYEAQVDEQNRGLAVDSYQQSRLAGQDDARDYWRKVAQVKGQQVAAMAANGIDVSFGSAQRVQDDTAMLAQDDAKRLYQGTEQKARGHLIEAANYAADAQAQKAKGNAAFVSSLFGAAGSLLGGVSQVNGLKSKISAGAAG